MSSIISGIANALGAGHDEHKHEHESTHGHGSTHEHEPVVQEHVKDHHEKHITPVVEKVIDQPVVHRSVQSTHEHEEHSSHSTSEAAAIGKETFGESEPAPSFGVEPEQTRETVAGETVINDPIVHETVKERHIEEVQPVLHRNVDHHLVEHVTQPIHEEHHAAPVYVDEGVDGGIKSPFET